MQIPAYATPYRDPFNSSSAAALMGPQVVAKPCGSCGGAHGGGVAPPQQGADHSVAIVVGAALALGAVLALSGRGRQDAAAATEHDESESDSEAGTE